MGYQCVEVACWPAGKAERRYAGVSHIDVDALDDEQVNYIHSYLKERGVEISAPPLAYYPNTWTATGKSAPPPWSTSRRSSVPATGGREPGDHRPRPGPRPWRRTSISCARFGRPSLKLAEELACA